MRIERAVEVLARDQTPLSAEVWRPDDDERRPAVLLRTAYGKEGAATTAIADARLATARGYAMVLQDVRGRGASGGTFAPFVHERDDGADTIAWVARQPWCDGRVVMAGMSYDGAVQWLAASAGPPALRAIAPTLSSDEYGEGWTRRAGVLEHGFVGTWTAAELIALEERWLDAPERAYDELEALAGSAPWLADWLEQAGDSAYWRERSVAPRRDAVTVPVLSTGGWFDIFLRATLRAHGRARGSADRLVIGPWGHDGTLWHLVGEYNAGAAGMGAGRWFAWALDFFDAVLAGRAPDAPAVRAYQLGARRWLDLDRWPPEDARAQTCALDPGEVAVDATDPVPTLGGAGLLVHVPGYGFGPRDQRPLLDRGDVLTVARLDWPEPQELAGTVTVRLDGDVAVDPGGLWVVTLCLQRADGPLLNISAGVAAAPAGRAVVVVELDDVCLEVTPEDALVVLVAGSSFPRWPRPGGDGRQRVLAGSTITLMVRAAR
jgi:putative CocE/NonD family hydrolase